MPDAAAPRLVPPDPPLDDGVVRLRPWTAADVDDVHRACDDADIARWTTVPHPYARHDAEAFVALTLDAWAAGQAACFAVVDADDGRLLGSIDLRLPPGAVAGVVGYWVVATERGRGVATRALRLLSQWAHGPLGLEATLLEVFEGNDASMRVAEQAGYHRAGSVTSSLGGDPRPAVLFSRVERPG